MAYESPYIDTPETDPLTDGAGFHWLITFADSMTLILAFFVLFISLSTFGAVNVMTAGRAPAARGAAVPATAAARPVSVGAPYRSGDEMLILTPDEIAQLTPQLFAGWMSGRGSGGGAATAGVMPAVAGSAPSVNVLGRAGGVPLSQESLTSIRLLRERTAHYEREVLEYLIIALGDFLNFTDRTYRDNAVTVERTARGEIFFTVAPRALFPDASATVHADGEVLLGEIARVLRDIPNAVVITSSLPHLFEEKAPLEAAILPLRQMEQLVGFFSQTLGSDHTERFSLDLRSTDDTDAGAGFPDEGPPLAIVIMPYC